MRKGYITIIALALLAAQTEAGAGNTAYNAEAGANATTMEADTTTTGTVADATTVSTAADNTTKETTTAEATGGKMTLRECMEYAVRNSLDVRSLQSETADARLDRRDAILKAFTPSMDADAYGYYRWGRSIDPETNTYVTITSLNNYLSASAGITLFNGFSAINNIKVAHTSLAMGLTKEQQEIDKVCLATMEAYFNVLYYKQLAEILQQQVDDAKETVRLAERQEELGTKGHADVVQVQADLSDREYELTSAVNNYNNALITLEDVMIWPVDEELAIDTDIASLQAGTQNNASTEEIINTAKQSMPSVIIAKGELDNAFLQLRTAKWQFLPSLNLYGGWSTSYYTYPGRTDYTTAKYWNQFRNNGGEYLQLQLSIPIYDRLSKHTRLSKQRNAWQRADYAYDKSLRDVESEVRRAVQDRDGAEAALQQAERRAEVQEEAYRLNFRKFEQGLISSLEFNTASGNYLKANAEKLNAQLQYQLKRRIVDYYNGISYIDQEN